MLQMLWFEVSLPRAGWNAGLLFCKKSWHLQKFGSAEKWVIFPLKKKICGEGRKGKKNCLEKSNHSYSLLFFSQCRTEEQLPPSPEDPPSHELSSLKSQRATACAGAPAALGFLRMSWSQLGPGDAVLAAASPQAGGEPTLPQATCFCSPISVLSPSWFSGKSLFCWKIPHKPFLIYLRVTRSLPGLLLWKKIVLFIWREEKNPVNANCHMVVSKPWASLLIRWNRPRWQHLRMLKGIVLTCWKKQPVKMTGSLLCPKWQHSNTQYAQRWLSRGSVMICETNFY